MAESTPVHPASPASLVHTWDATVRWFHWINVLCVVFLGLSGTLILNDEAFGIEGAGKVFLKTVHTYVGYVFAVNLVWRLLWATFGSKNARWRALLPVGSGYLASLRAQLRDIRRSTATDYAGHSPLARLMIAVLLLLLISQALTGLLLAGTDLYMPPLGSLFANWVTDGSPERLALLQPGSTEHVVESSYQAMRDFRSPFKEIHEYGFFVLLAAVVIHVGANVLAEVRFATGQISAMFSGKKRAPVTPVMSDNEADMTRRAEQER